MNIEVINKFYDNKYISPNGKNNDGYINAISFDILYKSVFVLTKSVNGIIETISIPQINDLNVNDDLKYPGYIYNDEDNKISDNDKERVKSEC